MDDLIPEGEQMTDDEWKGHCRNVVVAMRTFTGPFVSAISYEAHDELPSLSGTGSLIEVLGRRFLLTNEHVLIDDKIGQERPNLAYGLAGIDSVFRMLHGSVSAPFPIDCAICPVPDDVWTTKHAAATNSGELNHLCTRTGCA